MKEISVTRLMGEVVRKVSSSLTVEVMGVRVENPAINYIFGDGMYVKNMLDDYSKSPDMDKFPLVALFTPIREQRGRFDVHSKLRLNMLIACSTTKEYTNEEREELSFEKVLRPIYERLLEVIREDRRFNAKYDGSIPHEYTENYSYGRYGAYTGNGEAVSEPIDAINISSLELEINHLNCR